MTAFISTVSFSSFINSPQNKPHVTSKKDCHPTIHAQHLEESVHLKDRSKCSLQHGITDS